MSQPDPVDRIIGLMLKGLGDAKLRRACAELSVPVTAIDEAKRRLVEAASAYTREESKALALQRMSAQYEDAVQAKDTRAAISALKEINRLQGIFDVTPESAAPSESDAELAAIREHLIPLALAPAEMPLREHARIAAEELRRRGG
ncbi:MAG: hypothetical protein IT450_18035 [Phycisphaerales bacterium]|nr:hypothetical protein [Phycisphaerales bacterium]